MEAAAAFVALLFWIAVFAGVGLIIYRNSQRDKGQAPPTASEVWKSAQEKGTETARWAQESSRVAMQRAQAEAQKAKARAEQAYRQKVAQTREGFGQAPPPYHPPPGAGYRPPPTNAPRQPPPRGWTLAVDFGTSFTTAAVTDARGVPTILALDGATRMPSTIFLDEKSVIRVGRSAERYIDLDPTRGLRSPKASMNAPANTVVLGPTPVAITTITGAVLRRAQTEALRFTGGVPPGRTVLTHPATWSATAKQRLVAAARYAGIDGPIELLPEPVAAVIYYTSFEHPRAPVAVYDLGGGTFDTAVLAPRGPAMALAGPPSGNPIVGGNLFDELLVDWLLARLPADHVARAAMTPVTLEERRIRATVERRVTEAREMLSEDESFAVLLDGSAKPVAVVHRTDLEVLIADAVSQSVSTLRMTIAQCGLRTSDLAAVFLSGGAARTPLVRQLLTNELGPAVVTRGDPKIAVCMGAALAGRDHTVPATEPSTPTG